MRERGAWINMPRFGRMGVSLYSLGSRGVGRGKGGGQAGLMRLSPDLIRAFNMAGAVQL